MAFAHPLRRIHMNHAIPISPKPSVLGSGTADAVMSSRPRKRPSAPPGISIWTKLIPVNAGPKLTSPRELKSTFCVAPQKPKTIPVPKYHQCHTHICSEDRLLVLAMSDMREPPVVVQSRLRVSPYPQAWRNHSLSVRHDDGTRMTL